MPIMAILTPDSGLSTNLRAFKTAARTTVAVPCWSSCQTGICMAVRRWSRMPKHFGWAMSSRLMPPKEGSSALTTAMKVSGSRASSTSGTASTPPRSLKMSAFPSMTGSPASGPMSPSPRTRVPSETMAMVLPRLVSSQTCAGSAWMARQGSATPGYTRSRNLPACAPGPWVRFGSSRDTDVELHGGALGFFLAHRPPS